MLDVYSATLFRTATGDLPFEPPEVDVSGVAADPAMVEGDTEWLRENYPRMRPATARSTPLEPTSGLTEFTVTLARVR